MPEKMNRDYLRIPFSPLVLVKYNVNVGIRLIYLKFSITKLLSLFATKNLTSIMKNHVENKIKFDIHNLLQLNQIHPDQEI